MKVADRIKHHLTAAKRLETLQEFGNAVGIGDTVVAEIWGIPGDESTLVEVKGKVWTNYEGVFFLGGTEIMLVWGNEREVSRMVKSARIVKG